MRRLVAVLLLAGVAVAEEPGVFSELSFEEACRKAADGKKVVLVDFFTTWCGPCRKLDRVTWRDEKVAAWLGEKAIALKIDAEKEEALAEKYGVSAYPTVLLLRPDGTEIDRLVGFREPAEFLRDAGDALEGRDSVARAKAKLEGEGAKDPSLRQAYADALAERGRNEEALAEYLWCYDHGAENDEAYGSIRAAFLAPRIAQLGAKYAPAKEALKARRDAAVKALLSAGGAATAGEVASLDAALGEKSRTLEVYDELGKKEGAAEARTALRAWLFDQLLAAKRYSELEPDAAEAVGDLFESLKDAEEEAAKDASEEAKEELEFARDDVAESGGGWYEVLLGAGKKEAAAALAERILKVRSGGEAWAALVRHAARAGDADAARSLARRGLESAQGEDADAIREAEKEIPGK